MKPSLGGLFASNPFVKTTEDIKAFGPLTAQSYDHMVVNSLYLQPYIIYLTFYCFGGQP